MSAHKDPYECSYCLPSSSDAIFFLGNLSKGSFYHIIHLLHCLKNFFFFVMTTHSTIPLTIYNFDMFLPTIWGNFTPVCPVECLFEHLLGWDTQKKHSKTSGGILGKLHTYYGVAEFTDHSQLHGHFLLWIDGGLNP